MEKDTLIQICDCHSFNHQAIYWYDEDENVLYVHIHLVHQSFWGRLKYAIKYLFGYTSNYGAWDELIFGKRNLEELYAFLKQYEKRIYRNR